MEKNNISIKQNPTPTIKQKIQFNYEQNNSLSILKMNNTELLYRLRKVLFMEQTNIKSYHRVEDVEHEWYKIDNSLQSELHFQYRLNSLNVEDKYAYFIIDSLDDNGFLTMSDEEYCTHLKLDQNEFFRILNELQKMKPTGIFARNSIDSIKIQLKQDNQDFAFDLFSNHAEELINKDYSLLAKVYQCDVEEIMDAIDVIKEQAPFPAAQYDSNMSLKEIIIPDVEIKIENNKVFAYAIDPIKDIFEDYTSQIQSDSVLKAYFDQANILIEDITKRNKTLMLVMNEIIKCQKNHFLYGDEIAFCTMKEIAQNIGSNISTVSRCIKDKFYIYNDNIYPVRLLLNQKCILEKNDDIICKIKDFIEKEDKEFPYSDYTLYLLLKKEGYTISRITVSKYRKLLNMPSSYERKESNK